MPDGPAPEHTAAPSLSGTAGAAAGHAAGGAARLGRSWRALDGEYRLAAVAALGLFFSMLLPWYEQTSTGVAAGKPVTASNSLSAFQVFSWVEAAVLLVSIGVLILCFARGERRAFHLPGGDGTVVLAAGAWVCALIFIRQLDKPEPEKVPGLSATMGVQWGIFVAFIMGLLLAYAGLRLRHASRPEPSLVDEAVAAGRAPGEAPADTNVTPVVPPHEAPTTVAARRRAPAPGKDDDAQQLTFDE